MNVDIQGWRSLIEGRKIPESYIRWKYMSHPYEEIHTWVMVGKDGFGKHSIVGQYTIQPQEYWINGIRVKGGLAFDLAVHPDHRKRGLFVRMGLDAMIKAKYHGINFTLGFPFKDGIALPGHRKVGWTMLYPLYVYEKQIPKVEKIEDYSITEIYKFETAFNRLAIRHKKDCPVMLVRDADYLNWRYSKESGSIYLCYKITDKKGLIGYFILKGHDEYIHIIDYILPKDEKVYDLVLNKIYHFCWQIALKVSLIVNEKSHFYDYLKRCGFERQEKYFEPIVYFNNPFFNQDWFKDVDNYYFTMGDNDVF